MTALFEKASRQSNQEDFEVKSLQDHMISYVMKRQTIDDLTEFAVDESVPLEHINIPIPAQNMLRSDEGKRELLRWFAAFTNANGKMTLFDEEYKSGRQFNHADWRLMDYSATTALGALAQKLTAMAEAEQEELSA